MANPPPLLTAGYLVMDALLFNSEQGDDDDIIYHHIKHVKIDIADYLSITALTNMPTPDIARACLVWQDHIVELMNEFSNSFRRYLFDGEAIGAASSLLDKL